MGTMLQDAGLKAGQPPESLNVTQPRLVTAVHAKYVSAGAELVLTNTFGANAAKLKGYGLTPEAVIPAAVKAAKESGADIVGLDIGPIGELLSPMGALSPDGAYNMFAEQIKIGAAAGADVICIETIADLYEAKLAVLAAKENCHLPVFCTMTFEPTGRTFVGTSLASMALTISGLGVDALGVNCSVGPAEALAMAEEIMRFTNVPVIIKPNAGLPKISGGKAYYSLTPEEFAARMGEIYRAGVAVLGGCCGTTPAHIEKLAEITRFITPARRHAAEPGAAVCSSERVVKIDKVRVIGERINPTGKRRLQAALQNGETNVIIKLAAEQISDGADILDVNVGAPGIDEAETMRAVVRAVQSVAGAPLMIDSTKPEVIEAGLRAVSGKAIINSINGDDDVMDRILPIARKYGAAVVGLTMDRNGLPKTAQKRLNIADKIVERCGAYGIPRQDVFIDCLTLTAGAEQKLAYETLNALSHVKRLGVKTVLGISNISFGLPERERLNHAFLALALANGLDMPIINPASAPLIDLIYCYHQLKNIDKDSARYIERFGRAGGERPREKSGLSLSECVVRGLGEDAGRAVKALLAAGGEPLDLVNLELIPALDAVGRRYEAGEVFLPQLLRSAEAAKTAFAAVNAAIESSGKETAGHGEIILATVLGDVHDIGKNIVKVVLENYGFSIVDLGKDVPPETVVSAAESGNARLVGLSALMTTTLESMKNTIDGLKERAPGVKIMVGGAVLTEPFAKAVGADYYAKDAMAAVRIAREVYGPGAGV
jgi:5-methyltetrahydrofolate--homocysteine methyltransferase